MRTNIITEKELSQVFLLNNLIYGIKGKEPRRISDIIPECIATIARQTPTFKAVY